MPGKKGGSRRSLGVIVALHLPVDPQQLYTRCFAIWEALKADPATFPTPFPPAPVVEADLAALAEAVKTAEGGTTADAAVLTVAAGKVRQTFGMLGKYVQSVARAGAAEDAPALVAKVLMYISNVGKRRPKPPLEVRQRETSGTVLLVALAVESALVYYWEYSLDGQTWTLGAKSGQSRVSVAGLTPGKVYSFRFHAFKRDGTSTDPSQVVTFLVK